MGLFSNFFAEMVEPTSRAIHEGVPFTKTCFFQTAGIEGTDRAELRGHFELDITPVGYVLAYDLPGRPVVKHECKTGEEVFTWLEQQQRIFNR